MSNENKIKYSDYIPFDPTLNGVYNSYITAPGAGGVQPFEYSGWRDEQRSWHENCYIHAGLNPTATYRIKGPDALKLLSDHCVNTFKNFPVGKGKHGIMCNEEGHIMMDGLIMRTGEDEFVTYWMWPYIEFVQKRGNYDVVGENLTGKVFLYQLGGPRSLEIVEEATREDHHDIRFIHSKDSNIDGRKVNIIRVGMAGSLAYEVHGDIEDAIPVYNALLKAGEKFGLRRLGRHAYWNTHTECGFPQLAVHFLSGEDEDFNKYMVEANIIGAGDLVLAGSMGSDIRKRYSNPIEVGWGKMVNFDHDFVGKAALEKEKANPSKQMVTLEWNTDDVMSVYRSDFEEGEPYDPMDGPEDFSMSVGVSYYVADQVLKDGKLIGSSSGRMISSYYRKMISLCSIDTEYSAEGTEVTVLWGSPGTRQKEIRATVARWPYLNKNRNENMDVDAIPRRWEKK